MNLKERVRRKLISFLGIEKLTENPKGERFTYLSNEEEVIRTAIQEYKAWYSGDSNELLNFYTQDRIHNLANAVYNRNRVNYFWAISTGEYNIKRVHSGIPKAIISTLVNVIGNPTITINDDEKQAKIDRIIDDNDLMHIINQQQMPLTMAEGWGAYKINIEKINEFKKDIVIDYYEAENVDFIYKSRRLIGIVYKDYYKIKDKDYVLLETRRTDGNHSYIEYELYRLNENNEVQSCELTDFEEFADLQNLVIENVPFILGVPSIFFFDEYNRNYGKSIFAGKIDLFDDLDQILSQDSQTVRVSTPVEYIPTDLCERSRTGKPILPDLYNRIFIAKETAPNGDGETDGKIETTQPVLNFAQYSENAKTKLDYILTGVLSPATMGIDIAKKDNAEAQREKEKVTIMTRNNIIDRQTKTIKNLLNICLMLEEYLETGSIPLVKNEFNITYNEFANPSFENQLETLGTAYINGEISTERYVELLWGDRLSKAEKLKEIAWLDSNKQADNLTFADFTGDSVNETTITTDINEESEII